MKTLNDHLILFDGECPMCRLYTKAFVKTGLLEKDGRLSYQEFDHASCPAIDMQRAANEIVLVNQKTNEVTYGIQSLFKVFGTAVPLLRPLFAFKPFIWLMSKVYSFVSYNRRQIVPAAVDDNFRFQPSFKLHYRIAYLLFAWAVTSYILTRYVTLMQGVVPAGGSYREYLVCGGQIFFQGMVISFINRKKLWDYLGNMMTISLAGALFLLPVLGLAPWIGHAPLFHTAYFMLTAGLMLLEHIQRSRLLQLGWALSMSWVFYRLLVLLLITINN